MIDLVLHQSPGIRSGVGALIDVGLFDRLPRAKPFYERHKNSIPTS